MGRHRTAAAATRRRAAVFLAVVLALLLTAGCGKTNTTAGGGLGRTISLSGFQEAPVPAGAHGPSLARDVARSLLSAIRVPSDAIPVGSVPRSSPISSVPARSVTPNLVDVHRIWRVPGSTREVLAIIHHSHPAGLTINGGGSAGEHAPGEREHEYLWYVTFHARPQPGLNSEQLAISTIAAPGSGTLLRADAEVVWLSQRPAAEHVPAGVSSIVVTRVATIEELLERQRTSRQGGPAAKRHARRPTHGAVTLHRVIISPAAVRRLVAAIDALPIVQPGAWVCPAEPFGPIIHLTFRGRTGRILAEAVQGAGAEVGNCSPMYFSVQGREEKPLAKGASVIAIVSQTLGVGLLPR
jgi:hypothetical protein